MLVCVYVCVSCVCRVLPCICVCVRVCACMCEPSAAYCIRQKGQDYKVLDNDGAHSVT